MDYKTSIITSKDKEISFYAITTDLDKWWGKVDNSVTKKGDEFSVFFGNTEWRFRITQFVPFEKITWKCMKAIHIHDGLTGIEKEWLHTELFWEINEINEKTEITMRHKGLIPNLNCYAICQTGWEFFICTSLKNYLETGQGNPHYS